jgi:hypothetical protein
VTEEELQEFIEQKIEKAKVDRSTTLGLTSYGLTRLPESIGTLSCQI